MSKEVEKQTLAVELSGYKFKERLKIYRAAKCLRKFDKLTSKEGDTLEELTEAVEELENEK